MKIVKITMLLLSFFATILFTGCTTNPPNAASTTAMETATTLRLEKIDSAIFEQYGGAQTIRTVFLAIYLGPGQKLHLNANSDRAVFSGYLLPDGKNYFGLHSWGYSYDGNKISDIRTATEKTIFNIEIEVGQKSPNGVDTQVLPNGIYPAGYYTFIFLDDPAQFWNSPILSQQYEEWNRAKKQPVLDVVQDIFDKNGVPVPRIDIRYWVERVR